MSHFFVPLALALAPVLAASFMGPLANIVSPHAGGSTLDEAAAPPPPKTTNLPVSVSDILPIPSTPLYPIQFSFVPSVVYPATDPTGWECIYDPFADEAVKKFANAFAYIKIARLQVTFAPINQDATLYTLRAGWAKSSQVAGMDVTKVMRLPGAILRTVGGPMLQESLTLPVNFSGGIQAILKSSLTLTNTPRLCLYITKPRGIKADAPCPIEVVVSMDLEYDSPDFFSL